MSHLIDLSQGKQPSDSGEKALNLHWLIQQGFRVPPTYVLPFSVYADYRRRPKETLIEIAGLLAGALDPGASYAVRSSANLEDSHQYSFAGQFQTYLSVRGVDETLKAVEKVWRAAQSPAVQAYLHKTGQPPSELKMAVIIQKMVKPVVSGVAFSKNPLTGLNEIVIEAVQGSGEQLVQEGKTPERWVQRWGAWIEKPPQGATGGAYLEQAAAETAAIARKYGCPVDLEWVFDGEQLNWVQLRPITHLEGINIYSNRISREVFPGLIKPLIWSVNVPLVNTVWIELFTEMIGANDLKPADLAKSFGFRAYFNMGTIGRIFELLGFPRESLELLLGLPGGSEKPRFKPGVKTVRLLPRLVGFALGKLRLGGKVLPALAASRREMDAIRSQPLAELDEKSLLEQIDRLYAVNQKVAYLNVAVPLLMSLYNAWLRRQLGRLGVDYARFDLTQGMAELADYEPNGYLRRAAELFRSLEAEKQAEIEAASFAEFTSMAGVDSLRAQVDEILARFGHLSESGNDFSAAPWRETPALVLQMVISEAERLERRAAPHGGIKTHLQAQVEPAANPEEKIAWEALKLSPLQRWMLAPVYRRARTFHLYREAVSSTYTYGYGLFRIFFREIGRRLAGRGLLAQAEDVFYLDWQEIRQAVNDSPEGKELQEQAARRKAELHASRELALPETIYGDELPPPREQDQVSDVLRGIPSARGYYRGPVKVIRSPAEFGKLLQGDVLVIPFSDVSWTPLFTRAGAVIAESGGILSHSSIVAREFNLPCVVSVSHACQIPDNALVVVDGYKGEVIIEGAAQAPAAISAMIDELEDDPWTAHSS